MTMTKRNHQICYFEPNTAPECKPVNGECPNDWPMNEDGNCHPGGECPDGFGRVDDDETGTCYDEDDIVDCDNGAKVLDEDDCAIYDPNPPGDPRQICYFEPNDEVCNPDENGECLEGMGFNDDGQCIPQGSCPDGYARLDDDETGRCYAEAATKICPPNNIRVLQSETCPEVPEEPEAEVNDPCNYHGTDVCIGSGDERQCDSERFDCLSVCEDGTTRTTGQCPGDDEARTTPTEEPTPTEPEPTPEPEPEPEPETDSEETEEETEEREEETETEEN